MREGFLLGLLLGGVPVCDLMYRYFSVNDNAFECSNCISIVT